MSQLHKDIMKQNVRLIVIVLLLLLALAAISQNEAPAQESLNCSSCGLEIHETYYRLEGRILCEQCYRNSLPRCSVCGKRIEGQYWLSQGKVYCGTCVPRCYKCGSILAGQYWKIKDGNVCQACYAKCGPRCYLCNNVITGKYYQNADTDRIACELCYSRYDRCRDCGAPVGPRGITVEKDFTLCPDCAKTAIFSQEDLMPIFREAKYLVRIIFGIEPSISEDNIILTSGQDLRSRVSQTSEYVPRGGAAGLYLFRNGISTIYVQKGHSPERTLEILAHEYAHLWQEQNCPRKQDEVFREGFAEWVAYKVLLHKNLKKLAESKKANPDPTYGEGLRKMLYLEGSIGPAKVVDYVRVQRGF